MGVFRLRRDPMSAVFSWIPSLLFVAAPIAPYIPQAMKMREKKSSEGFSPYVCLVLLLANILRICFWYGKRFGLELLWQSFVMIVAQLLMLYLWFTLRPATTPGSRFRDQFWNWNHFVNYCKGSHRLIEGRTEIDLGLSSVLCGCFQWRDGHDDIDF